MHVLFVHNDYGRHSGEEQAAEGIAALLTQHGHRVTWMRKSSAGIDKSFAMKARAFGAGIWSPASRRAMGDLLRQDRPDVVQVQNLYPFISSSVLSVCRQQGVPVVMRCPNYRLFCPAGLHLRAGEVCEKCLGPGREWNCIRFNCEGSLPKSVGHAARNGFNRLTGAIVENVDAFVVLSEFQRARFEASGIPAGKLRVVSNYAPTHIVRPTPVPEDGHVAFVGRVDRAKGILEFLEAARRLPATPFAVFGHTGHSDSPLRDLPTNVQLKGFLSGERLEDAYRQARLVVCPSRWFEGFPNVVVQAMAHGRPVVGTSIGVIPEIVRDGQTGLLCPQADGAALARAIESLCSDPERCVRMGQRGREIAETLYSPDSVLRNWMTVYGSVQ
jgi:glycosyltransferase involved in cell wall biosynthesis